METIEQTKQDALVAVTASVTTKKSSFETKTIIKEACEKGAEMTLQEQKESTLAALKEVYEKVKSSFDKLIQDESGEEEAHELDL